MKTVMLEFYKLRRKRLLLMISMFLSVEIGWAFLSVSKSMSRNPDSSGWDGALVIIASLNGLFLPLIAAVVVSRLCDMEHKGNTWKLLTAASLKRHRLYFGKYACACILLLFAVIAQMAAIAGFGAVSGFGMPVPFSELFKLLAGTMLTNAVVIALQQWISLAVKNQAFGLCLGMIGGFIGMTADLFPAAVRRILIWSYYSGLSPVTYNFVNETMEFVPRQIVAFLPASVLLMGAAVYIAGSVHVSRQDIH
ncbi:hypothetical protein PAE9249_01929 [Paenibacillus sp. CECT 9249]|uniref:ABC transporter permease n=1 Tax=Paenibacillus sp. CECT 9249 TaxID=2845385 RepID=UPI001E54500C|nr:ABC transporter permease [Paenibacillus sp. CECT 9249]CAH0119426.1 hypothetical protein PAE9249_01929 [Paenibacillus sp. CECT 9249]